MWSSKVLPFASFAYSADKTVLSNGLAMPRSSVDEPLALKSTPPDTFVKARKQSPKEEGKAEPEGVVKQEDSHTALKIVAGIAGVALVCLVVALLIQHHKETKTPHLSETPSPSKPKGSTKLPKTPDPKLTHEEPKTIIPTYNATPADLPPIDPPPPSNPSNGNEDAIFRGKFRPEQDGPWEFVENTGGNVQINREVKSPRSKTPEATPPPSDESGYWEDMGGTDVWIPMPPNPDGKAPPRPQSPKTEYTPPNTGSRKPPKEGENHQAQSGFNPEDSSNQYTQNFSNGHESTSRDWWAEFQARQEQQQQEMNDFVQGNGSGYYSNPHTGYPDADTSHTGLNPDGTPLDLWGNTYNFTDPYSIGMNDDWVQRSKDFLEESQQASDKLQQQLRDQQNEFSRQQQEDQERIAREISQNLNWDSGFNF